jgi:hypothetical protein
MGMIIERVTRAIADNQHQSWLYDDKLCAMCRPDAVADNRRHLEAAARAVIAELRDILNMTSNSSLNYTADELDAELRESS